MDGAWIGRSVRASAARSRHGRAALRRRHPSRPRPARQARAPGLRAGADHRIDTNAAGRLDGVRCIMTAADLPQPVPRYGPRSPIGRFSRSARRSSSASRSPPSPPRRRMPPRRRPPLVRVESRGAAGRPHRRRRRSIPARRSCRIRRFGRPAARAHQHSQEWQFGWGDVDTARADCVVEHDYKFPMVTHFAIEPHAFMAAPGRERRDDLEPDAAPVRAAARRRGGPELADLQVRIIAPDPGGGFGGKGWPKFEPLMAFLALRTGRPVRLVLTLEETFQRCAARRRASTRARASQSGPDRLPGYRGGFPARRLRRHRRARRQQGELRGVRSVPDAARARHRARAAVAHDAEHGVSRVRDAAGVLGRRIAVERSGAAARDRSGRDSAAQRPGPGRSVHSQRHAGRRRLGQRAPQAARRHRMGWTAGANRGRGISLGLKSSSTASASLAIVRLHYDGSATVLSGTSDMGQGARTVFTQIAAQELGIPPDRVAIVMGDTRSCRSTRRRRPAGRRCSWGTRSSRPARTSRPSCGAWRRSVRVAEARSTVGAGGRPRPDRELTLRAAPEGRLRTAPRRGHRHRRGDAARYRRRSIRSVAGRSSGSSCAPPPKSKSIPRSAWWRS